jgi:hypothetical protein
MGMLMWDTVCDTVVRTKEDLVWNNRPSQFMEVKISLCRLVHSCEEIFYAFRTVWLAVSCQIVIVFSFLNSSPY